MPDLPHITRWTCEIGFIDESDRYGAPGERQLGTWPIPSVLVNGGSILSLPGIAADHAEYLSNQCPDGWLYFRILNPSGHAIDVRYAGVTGSGIYANDVLTLPINKAPHPDLDQLWLIWKDGQPASTGLWRTLAANGLLDWRAFSVSNQPECQPPATHVVEGPVRTAEELHLALGEAMRGPGGYYGDTLNGPLGLAEYLTGGLGPPAAPFTLYWPDPLGTWANIGTRSLKC